ncbi:MAG: hypothetical protein HOO91_06230 [Bacteroidales bacterium]|nr:hypothetical protein [Bacteroidales bacterium]
MNNYKFKWYKESNIFYFVFIVNLILIFTVRFYPSIDGPSHLYNANIISHLVSGNNTPLNDFYILNKIPTPNWLSHFLLSLFIFVFPAWLAEKLLLIIYLTGLVFSFRLLIKELSPDNVGLSIFIFPFAYSFLFYLGFYNYCLSFILLFFSLYYWLGTRDKKGYRKHIVMFLLLTITYFSNILTYAFTGFCLGLFIVAFSISNYLKNQDKWFVIKSTFKELLFLFISAIPSLILFIIFYSNITFSSSDHKYTTDDLFNWIDVVRPLIIYDGSEGKISSQFLHLIIIIVSISVYRRFNNPFKSYFSLINKNDVLLLPILLSLVLLFIVPDGSGAGMMSDRYCIMFYMLLIIWVASQPLNDKIRQLIVLIIVFLHFALLFKHTFGVLKMLDKEAICIYKTSDYIEPNTIVLPVNFSDNWLEPNFFNYLGVDKQIILLQNYEASIGWFPVKWNMEKMPKVLLGNRTTISSLHWLSNTESNKVRKIDYVFLYGNTLMLNDPRWKELKEILISDYKLIYISDNKWIELYKLR